MNARENNETQERKGKTMNETKAHNDGWKAARGGERLTDNPFTEQPLRGCWFEGFHAYADCEVQAEVDDLDDDF